MFREWKVIGLTALLRISIDGLLHISSCACRFGLNGILYARCTSIWFSLFLRLVGNSMIYIWLKYHEWYFKTVIVTVKFETIWNITSGIYEWYQPRPQGSLLSCAGKVPIPVADQKDRGLWERDWSGICWFAKYHVQIMRENKSSRNLSARK